MAWHVTILRPGGRTEGPFSEEEILDMLDEGKASRSDWVWAAGKERPVQLGELFRTISGAETGKAGASGEMRPAIPPPALFPDLAASRQRNAEGAEETEATDEDDEGECDHAEAEADDDDDESDERSQETGTAEDAPEKLYWVGHPSFWNYWPALAVAVVSLVGGWMGGTISPTLVIVGFAVGLLFLVWVLVHRASTRYYLTDRRLEKRSGLVWRSAQTLYLEDVVGVEVKAASGAAGLFGVGSLVVSAASGTEDDVAFVGIANTWRVKEMLVRVRRRLS